MKNTILERYPQMPDGCYVIDINAGCISDLYNDFDRIAPYVRKELDQDLVDYITDSARDLGKVEYLIRFRLQEQASEDLQARIIKSINSYFLYLRSIELSELGRMMKTSLGFLLIGIFILFLSVWVNGSITDDSSVIQKVFAEGLTVAAWVAMWESLATFLFNWTPISRKVRLYKRIASTPVQFARSGH